MLPIRHRMLRHALTNGCTARQGGGARFAKLMREMINDDHRGIDIRA